MKNSVRNYLIIYKKWWDSNIKMFHYRVNFNNKTNISFCASNLKMPSFPSEQKCYKVFLLKNAHFYWLILHKRLPFNNWLIWYFPFQVYTPTDFERCAVDHTVGDVRVEFTLWDTSGEYIKFLNTLKNFNKSGQMMRNLVSTKGIAETTDFVFGQIF